MRLSTFQGEASMFRTSILLVALISAVSCDIFEEILRMSASGFQAKDTYEPDKGYVKNCDPSESTFFMDWYPKYMVKGETVTVEGNYTFPEDFVEGEVKIHVKVGPFPLEKSLRFDCSEISEKPCKQGYTAVGKRTMTVPRDLPIPAGKKFKVEAELINSNTGDEIGCAEAEIELRDREYIDYNRGDIGYSGEDTYYNNEDTDFNREDTHYNREDTHYRENSDYDYYMDLVK